MKTLTSWSYTSLINYEKCAYLAWLKHGEKVPEGENKYSDRGIQIHKAAEDFVQKKGPMTPELETHFGAEFKALQRAYGTGHVSLEGEWGFDKNWAPVDWRAKECWGRMKLDALVLPTPEYAVVIDYKSGKRFGNEIKHGEQMELYQLGTFIRYPNVQKVTVELWYVDKDELHRIDFTRAEGLRRLPIYNKRAVKMTTATKFPPNPNVFNCPRCPYGPNNTGHCKYGERAGNVTFRSSNFSKGTKRSVRE